MNNTPEDESDEDESIQSSVSLPKEIKQPNVNLNNTPEDESDEDESIQSSVSLPKEIKQPNVKLNNTPNKSLKEKTPELPNVSLNVTPEESESEESSSSESESEEEYDSDFESDEEGLPEELMPAKGNSSSSESDSSSESESESEEESNKPINSPENKTIRDLKNSCKLKTLTTDFYKERLNEGQHKCIHKKPIEKDWHQYFKPRTTSLITFGIKNKVIVKNKDDEITYLPSVRCNYFLLSLLLKDCNKDEYKGQFSTNYINDIKKYLIDGYRNLMNDDNAPLILKKWQKYGRKEDTISIMKSSRKYIESFELRINHPMYRLSIIDFVIFMAYYNIPILLIYQSKKTATSNGIKLLYTMDSPYYYIIKVHNQTFEIGEKIKEVNVFDLHLWCNGRRNQNKITTIRFSKNKKEQITPKLFAEIDKEKNLYTFEEYLNKVEL